MYSKNVISMYMEDTNKGNAVEFLISESMMRWLLEQGADINYVDTYGYTSLLYHAGYTYAEEQVI